MNKRLWIFHAGLASILLVACRGAPPAPAVVIPPGFAKCADFTSPTYSDDDHPALGNATFSEAGFVFADPTHFQFINQISGATTLGLQFPNSGLEITMPAPVNAMPVVSLDMGGFASGIKIAALNSTGATVTTKSLTADNMLHNIILAGPDLRTITFLDGHNEGILERICIN